MDDTAIKQYDEGQYASALKFYDERSVWNKRWYRVLSIYVLVISAGLAPFIAIMPKESDWRIATAILTASIVVATGLLAHFKFHENWLSFRSNWDALKREKAYRDAGIHEYRSCADRNALFVERVESILAREGSDFFARHYRADEPSRTGVKKQ